MTEIKFLAGIDIGSNTIKLLLIQKDDQETLWRREYIRTTRLGELDVDNQINPVAFKRSLEVIDEFLKMSKLMGAKITRIIATSAVRDATNSAGFVRAIGKLTATPVEVLSGEDEARYSYIGAKSLTKFARQTPIIDVGGASTEVINEQTNGTVKGVSVNIGAVRMKKNNWDKSTISVRFTKQLCGINISDRAVGVGGTITTLAGLILDINKFDESMIEGMIIKKNQLEELLDKLLPLTPKERCEYSPLLSKRGEIIEQGLLIWITLMEVLGLKEIIVSTGGVLDGAIADMI